MIKIFKKAQQTATDGPDNRFQKMVDLVKDLSRADFNKQMDALRLIYDGYAKASSVKTNEEKENQAIDEAEHDFLEVKNA